MMIDLEALEGIRAELKRTPYTEFSADNVRALVGMVDELRAERTWRPIETAPRDGTRILGLARRVAVIQWNQFHKDHGEWVSAPHGAFPEPDCMICPTHWMPLPPAPDVG